MGLKKAVLRRSKRTKGGEAKARRAGVQSGRATRGSAGIFPIVGVGASAGGLEAFTKLLKALPSQTGMAFVLVQHLDPKHESMLARLLSHSTPMPVHEACDGMRLETDHVYVIPPNKMLAVLHGRLSLMPRADGRGQNLPVDFFLRSLAEDRKRRAIGVVLSGTASDGTAGLRAIKAAGGVAFAQDEESAKYSGMPHSARAAGVVDFVLPPEQIARELVRIGQRAAEDRERIVTGVESLPDSDEELNKIFILLRGATSVDFSFYRPTTIKRRITRRMQSLKIESLLDYVAFLRQNPKELEDLYKVKRDGGYQVSKAVRDVCVFARQDVAKDPPFSKLDLISCRNLLIYFGPELQKRVIPTFHYALKSNGILLLGGSETVGGFADLFSLADRRHKFYVRKSVPARMDMEMPAAAHSAELSAPGAQVPNRASLSVGFDYQKELDRLILNAFSPPGVVVNDRLEIVQFRGQTGRFLEPMSGAASLNLLKMVREGLMLELRGAFNEAKRHRTPAQRKGVPVKIGEVGSEVDLEVIPLQSKASSRPTFFLILFHERGQPAVVEASAVNSAAPAKPRLTAGKEGRLITQLKQELTAMKDYLQSVIGEQERMNEELQSANEEILSSNEKLQSTNEELETAKEELQSTNEELTTVNDELHTRNSELSQLNNDLVNLLNSVQIPIVILDSGLRIRRFTPPAERLLNLIPTDVGRPLSNLRPNLVVQNLEQLILDVMDSLTPNELQVQDHQGRWHSLRIRPYRTLENKIDGVILALVDIDAVRGALTQAREAKAFAEAVIKTIRQPLLVLEADLRVKTANRAFYDLFRMRPEEAEGRFIHLLGHGEWNVPELRQRLEQVLGTGSRFEGVELVSGLLGTSGNRLRVSAYAVLDEDNHGKWILVGFEPCPP